MAFHVLVCGLVAGDLDELDDEEHGDPDQLHGGPEGEDDGEGVAVHQGAEARG